MLYNYAGAQRRSSVDVATQMVATANAVNQLEGEIQSMQIALENVIQVLGAADTQFYSCQLQESALYHSDGARPNNRLRKIKHHQIVMYMSRQLI